MPYPKINLYANVLPYVKPDAQDITQTPEADGWRAPNIPEKIANTSVQQYRDFTLESIHWGLQTVITPLLEQILAGGIRNTYDLNASQSNGVLTGLAATPYSFLGAAGAETGGAFMEFTPELTKGAIFNARLQCVFIAHPAPPVIQNWMYQKKIKIGLFKNQTTFYTYGRSLNGFDEQPFAVIDLVYQTLDESTNSGYYIADLQQPIGFNCEGFQEQKIYAGLITTAAIAGANPPTLLDFKLKLDFTH